MYAVTPYYVTYQGLKDDYTCLMFPSDWVGTLLPPNWNAYSNHPHYFEVLLVDTYDGKTYKCLSWAHYANEWSMERSVNLYMFREHYCTCHRKIDAAAKGADTDDNCFTEEDRFVVGAITAPDHLPGLVLYSEHLPMDYLESLLQEQLQKGLIPKQ